MSNSDGTHGGGTDKGTGKGTEVFVHENTSSTANFEWQYNSTLNTQAEDFPSSLSMDSSNLDQVSIASRESWGCGHYSFLAGDL